MVMERKWTVEALRMCRESENRVEFKLAEQGNFSYSGGSKTRPADRRKCILGYVVAFCNEGGGSLVLGMHDDYPHRVVGTHQSENAVGKLESDIYRDVGIRPMVYELYEDEENRQGRVLVIDVPGRPKGKIFRFEDVPLMRVGEELRPMPDEVQRTVWQEQESDFSAECCEGATLEDLDPEAIKVMKEKYAKKQRNASFLSLPIGQVLRDLHLVVDERVTYAALILLGKAESLERFLPQSRIVLEYRKSESLIPYSNRTEYLQPYFLQIDNLWHDINLRNNKIDIREGAYIFNIPFFDEEVTREAINNAVAHRDYRRAGETFILQYEDKLVVKNLGGFPLGVTQENLLRVPSTPRNRLLADVLARTGVVERSGQGVDKMFRNMLSEGKKAPDYSHSDAFCVELHLSAVIEDVAFARFIAEAQHELREDERLSVFEVLALNQIREDKDARVDTATLDSLLGRGMIERRGKKNAPSYTLSKGYYEFVGKEGEYSKNLDWSKVQIWQAIWTHFLSFDKARMRDFRSILQGHMAQQQVSAVIREFVADGLLVKSGRGADTYYSLEPSYVQAEELCKKALTIGFAKLGIDLGQQQEPKEGGKAKNTPD